MCHIEVCIWPSSFFSYPSYSLLSVIKTTHKNGRHIPQTRITCIHLSIYLTTYLPTFLPTYYVIKFAISAFLTLFAHTQQLYHYRFDTHTHTQQGEHQWNLPSNHYLKINIWYKQKQREKNEDKHFVLLHLLTNPNLLPLYIEACVYREPSPFRS